MTDSDAPVRSALAEIAIDPTAEGERHGQVVADAVDALRDPALQVRVGALSTVVEGSLDDIFHAVQRAHQVAASQVERVVTTVRVESRRDGPTLEAREAEADRMQPRGDTAS